MKIFYFAVLASLLTVVTTVHTQAQTPEVSTFRTGKANEPIIGIGVAIPLRKLFGSGKRVKSLPKQPESASSQLIDQFGEPVSIAKPAKSSSQKPENSFEFKPDNRKDVPALPFLNVDLEEVRITAKRYELTPIVITWSQPKSMDGSPSGGGGGSSDNAELPNFCVIAYLLATLHPYDNGTAMSRNEQDVLQRIVNRFGDAFGDSGNEPLNAVKHAMFIAFNACDIGREHALNMGNLHENCSGVPPELEKERDMDIYNNDAGLMIFDAVGCGDRNTLAEAVFDAFSKGRLYKLDGTRTP